MLKQTAEDFLQRELSKARVRELFDSENGFAPDIWQQMGKLGWTGLVIPREYGGQESDFTTLGVLYEALGAALCPSPHLSSAILSALTLLEAGTADQKRRLLPAIARGDVIIAFAFTEADYGWSPEKVQLQARRQNNGYVLDGTKLFVPDAQVADQILVIARTGPGGAEGKGLTAFLIDSNSRGVEVRVLSGWLGDKMAEVSLKDIRVSPSSVVGAVGEAWPALEKALDRGIAALCAYMVGGCRRVLDMSTERSQTRIQFGVPIGTLQYVQNHLVTMVNIEQAARWATYEALWKLDHARADAPQAVSMAKAIASDGYFRAAEAAHHVHAGLGVDMGFGLPYYTQKARTLQSYLGDQTFHRARMARLMELDVPLPANAP